MQKRNSETREVNVNVQRDINEGGRERGSLKERAYRSMREERREVCGRQKRVGSGASQIVRVLFFQIKNK